MHEWLLSVFTVLCITPCSFLKESYNKFSLDEPMIFYLELLKKAKPYRKFQGLGSPLCGPFGPPCCFPAERLLGGIAL